MITSTFLRSYVRTKRCLTCFGSWNAMRLVGCTMFFRDLRISHGKTATRHSP